MGRVRFGPAGRPINYRGSTVGVPAYLKNMGLDAFEYQAVRGVRISENDARQLGIAARNHDVLLSLHAPYAINLSSEKQETIEASIERLVQAARAASWMGAYLVVFHPGYYGKRSTEEALRLCIDSLKRVVERLEQEGIREVLLGPETTGKTSQVGSPEEVLTMCREVPRCKPVLDFAHIHARYQGCIRTKDDYLKYVQLFEKELGDLAVKPLHIHFTHVDYGKSGERAHRTLEEPGYGPPFRPLAELLVELGYDAVIISESPVLDQDALRMKKILEEVLREKQGGS